MICTARVNIIEVKRIGIAVMASGEGRRFGSNKLLADAGGKTIIERTLDTLGNCIADIASDQNREILSCRNTVVVTRTGDIARIAERYGLRAILHSEPWKSDTVRLGTEAVEQLDGIMFVQADQFLVSECSIGRLIDAYRRDPDKPARLCYGDKMGSPVIFPPSFYGALKSLSGDNGGSMLLKAEAEDSSSGNISLVEAGEPYEVLDADTPTQLEAMLQISVCESEH